MRGRSRSAGIRPRRPWRSTRPSPTVWGCPPSKRNWRIAACIIWIRLAMRTSKSCSTSTAMNFCTAYATPSQPIWRKTASRRPPSATGSRAFTASTAKCSCSRRILRRSTTFTPYASSSIMSRSATPRWASSMTCTIRCPTGSRTTSPRPSPTATRACIPPSSGGRPSPLRCRSVPGKWIATRNTASPPTGNTRRASAAVMTSWTPVWPGCASCWKASAPAPMPPTCSAISRATCSRRRSLPSRPAAMSSTCPRAQRSLTSPMPSILLWATA